MYLIQTVQTSWRPQLPLPKEPDGDSNTTDEQDASTIDVTDMEKQRPQHHHATTSPIQQHANSRKDNSLNATQNSTNHTPASNTSTTKKWSFGRLFRRKKEIATDSSSEEDRKAGFTPTHRNSRATTNGSNANLKSKSNKTNKLSRSSKLNGASFDHIVINPQTGAPITPPHPQLTQVDHEFFLPVETISPSEAYYQNQQSQYLQHGAQPVGAYTRSSNSLDRRAARAAYKTRSVQRLPNDAALGAPHTSSEEELISLNSSTFSKYRSDESIHSGGQGVGANGQSRRSRAARNERYYKRLSRDGEPSSGQVPVMYAPQPTQRWKTQPVPLSIYNPAAQAAAATPRLRNTSSLQHVAPYVQWGQLQQQQQQQQQPKNLQNSVNDAKRSISYDSHIHLQNINGRLQTKPLPPPPPPRDPLRRVNVSGQMQNGSSSSDLRPISYAFDQSGLPVLPATSQRLHGRCVSDDKIWSGPAGPHYQSVHSLNTPTVSTPQYEQMTPQQAANTPHHRRFITRAERDAHPAKKSLPNGLEFHYVADATPRSRKPIHMLEPQYDAAGKEPTSSVGILRTTKSGLASPSSNRGANDFWQRMDADAQQRGREAARKVYAAAEVHPKPRSISSSRVSELRAYPIYSEVQKPKREPQASPHASGVDEVDNIVCGSLHIKSKPDNSNANYVEIRNKDYSKSNSMPNQYQRRSGEIPNTPNKYDEYVAEKREQHHKPIFATPTPPQRKLSIPPSKATELPIYFPRKKPANLEEAINELEAIYKSLGLTEEPEKKERVPTPSEFEKYALARADEFDDDEDSPAGEPDPIRDDVAYRNMQLANLQHKTAEKQPPFGIPIGPVVAAPQTDYLHVAPIVETAPVAHAPDIVKDDLAVRALRKDPPGPKDKFIYPYSSFQQKKNRATRTQSANIYNLIHRDAAKPSGGDLHSYLELTRNLDRAGSMSDLHKDEYGERASDVPATLALLRNLKEQEQQLTTAMPTAKKPAPIPFRHPSQGGAICALPEKLPKQSAHKEEVHKPPVPLPRKSLTPEPTAANAQMEDALNKIAKEAQEKSKKLTKELQELRKEALITAARPKANGSVTTTSTTEELEKDLQEIEAVSEAAKRCGKMLLDTLPDANECQVQPKPRKLHKEGKLIEAIDQVSEAANAVCEKILKDIVTTEPPVVIQEAVKVKNKQAAATTTTEALVTPNLIKKLDPIQSEKIEAIAKRCMRQLSELAEDNPDYDNLNQELKQREQQQLEQQSTAANSANAAAVVACNAEHIQLESAPHFANSVSTVAEVARNITAAMAAAATPPTAKPNIEEIDQIMQECEAKMRAENTYAPTTTVLPPPLPLPPQQSINNAERKPVAMRHLRHLSAVNSSSDDHTTAPSISSNAASGGAAGKTGASTTASSFSSSSDCLAKSSSPSAGRRQSSSITSFNPYSSSDYIKSPTSSDYHTPSTDPIKTFSTSSYDAQTTTSAAATPNISATTNSAFSYTPSPPPPSSTLMVGNDNATAVAAADVVSEASANVDANVGGAAISHANAATRQSQERQRARSLSSPSQYNSSEELAMIFGIDEQPRRLRATQQSASELPPTNVTGKNDVPKTIHANALSMPLSLISSSNHASALHVTMLETAATATSNITASQLNTNLKALDVTKNVCECIEPANSTINTVKRSPNAVVVVDNANDIVDVEKTTCTTPTPTTTISSSNISINNPTIISSHMNTKNSYLRLSPNSCKLASIPESKVEKVIKKNNAIPPLKLSPNFNKIYASKISIVVDNVTEQSARNAARLTQCDSLSSCEDETSSNPDSGNVSLADFPMCAQTNNVCLQLENAYNSRFEIKKKSFVSEVCIKRRVESEIDSPQVEDDKETRVTEEFPPPPSERELLDSLIEEFIEAAMEERNEDKKRESARGEESKRKALEDELVKERENQVNERVENIEYNEYDKSVLRDEERVVKSWQTKGVEISETYKPLAPEKLNSSDKRQICEFQSTQETTMTAEGQKSEELSTTQTLPTDGAGNEQNQNYLNATQNSSKPHELDDAHLIELAQLVSSSDARRNSTCSPLKNLIEAPKSMPNENESNTTLARIHTDLDHLRLAFNELLESNSNELDELPSIVEEEEDEDDDEVEEKEEALPEIESKDLHSRDTLTRSTSAEILNVPARKQSIVYETPPLNLNISEVKISYSASDDEEEEEESKNISHEMLTQISQYSANVEQLSAALNVNVEKEAATRCNISSTDTQLIPWRWRSRRNRTNDDNKKFDNVARDDEEPTTSAAAAAAATKFSKKRTLTVFGEAATAAAGGGLTTLEHVLLACSLGVITPTDLYTLCLIIIGMITLIAIVLF